MVVVSGRYPSGNPLKNFFQKTYFFCFQKNDLSPRQLMREREREREVKVKVKFIQFSQINSRG